jgi:hypothetical protein
MKKILLAVLIPLLLMGCISSGVTVKVNKDGSGEIIQTFKIIRDFAGFLSMSDEPTDPNLIDMEALELVAQTMGEEVKLVKVDPMPEDSEYAGYVAYFEFKDISAVRVSASPSTSPEAASEENNDWISFDFDMGSSSKLTIYLMDEEDGEAPTEEESELEASADDDLGDQLKDIYKTMHYWMTVEVNGKITNSNASFVDGSTVTIFDMNFEKIVENDELFKKVTGDDPGSMKTYKEELATAGVLVEDQSEIVVSFR